MPSIRKSTKIQGGIYVTKRAPKSIVKRLPIYLRVLDGLISREVEIVSSRALSEETGFTAEQIRKDLAAANNAAYTCPVTTGIFLRIVAENAFEEYQKGKALNKITPFWRAMSVKSPSAKKLTFGMQFLVSQQKKEGIIS